MRRRLPYFTPASFLFALFLLLGLGFAYWKAGGIGINPGPVSAKSLSGQDTGGFSSHADFEQDCARCHQPLGTSQAQLCQGCHQSVKDQIDTHQGLHGSLDPGSRCASCHPDHRGRDFDPTAFALAGLDHNQTSFPLTGKHMQAACKDCHFVELYRQAPAQCSGCHAEPAVHRGVFTLDCAGCHTSESWKPATINGTLFDHSTTSFQLTRHASDYAGQPLTCAECHVGKVTPFDAQAGCVQCHANHDAAFMRKHQDQYGPDCLACHDGSDRMVPFDHAAFFPLDGKHAGLDCAQCHANRQYPDAPANCAGCHKEPEIHAGAFGLKCDSCHTSDAWDPALLRKHTFPLDHGRRGEQTCQTCHPGSYAQYACYTCHAPGSDSLDHKPDEIAASHARANISAADLPDCARCHPGGKKIMFSPGPSRWNFARRAVWILAAAGIVLTILAAAAFALLAGYGPLQYGDGSFYTLQRWAEKTMVDLDYRPGGKANHLIDLAVRRNQDLWALRGTSQEPGALREVELGVYQAVLASTQADPADFSSLRPRLSDLLLGVQTCLEQLTVAPRADQARFEAYEAWLAGIRKAIQNPNLAMTSLLEGSPPPAGSFSGPVSQAIAQKPMPNAPVPQATGIPIDPRFVSFPTDSQGAQHEFFPLTGRHAAITCESCHAGGKFAGTPGQCVDCHRLQTPANHYTGDCATCHVPDSWKAIHFDHAGQKATDCQACHQKNAPPNHYPAQCSECHSTSAWSPAHFNHAAFNTSSCQACHSKITPANHFPGQCSLCHSDEAWKPASFNHQGGTASDCASCHTHNKPANHFAGQCSACHATRAWTPAKFDHGAANTSDCQSCHSKDKPAHHFDGQCSQCHSTSAWTPAKFDHSAQKATDCQACHTKNKPANHFAGQCSACHSTDAWAPAKFDHAAAGATDCQACHTQNKPANHFPGQCSQCHSTSAWTQPNSTMPRQARPTACPATPKINPPIILPGMLRLPFNQRLNSSQIRPQRRRYQQLPIVPYQG